MGKKKIITLLGVGLLALSAFASAQTYHFVIPASGVNSSSGGEWVAPEGEGALHPNGVTVTCKAMSDGEIFTLPETGITYQVYYIKTEAANNASTACTSNINNMEAMFNGRAAFNDSIAHWDTSSVTTMREMFYEASSFNQSIEYFDTSNVTNMRNMFYRANAFNQNLDKWDVSSVTDMSSMFQDALSFNGNIATWDTSSVTTMANMFVYAPFNRDISGWDVSSVTNMSTLFGGTSAFNQDISGWNVSSATNMTFMFFAAEAFNQNLSGWCVSNIGSKPNSFDGNATSWVLARPVWGTCP